MPNRKHVTPAIEGARIPDPERGDLLPPDGRTVTWSAHWAEARARGDIEVGPPPRVTEPEPEGDAEG